MFTIGNMTKAITQADWWTEIMLLPGRGELLSAVSSRMRPERFQLVNRRTDGMVLEHLVLNNFRILSRGKVTLPYRSNSNRALAWNAEDGFTPYWQDETANQFVYAEYSKCRYLLSPSTSYKMIDLQYEVGMSRVGVMIGFHCNLRGTLSSRRAILHCRTSGRHWSVSRKDRRINYRNQIRLNCILIQSKDLEE
jgi:hypothetical protein